MKVTKKKTTVVTETTTYRLHPNVVLKEVVVNDKQKSRTLEYGGKKVKDGFGDSMYFDPVYNPNLEYLAETNPCWGWNKKGDEKWWKGEELPENPEDIDISKIVLACSNDHTFWTVDLEPIPVVVVGDYIDAHIRSKNYNLKKLHEYFSKHKQIKSISKIELIPYYNNDSGREEYFTVNVLPTLKQLKKMGRDKDIFYTPWGKEDYLGMKQFWIGKDDY
jgi:hypothetical protein